MSAFLLAPIFPESIRDLRGICMCVSSGPLSACECLSPNEQKSTNPAQSFVFIASASGNLSPHTQHRVRKVPKNRTRKWDYSRKSLSNCLRSHPPPDELTGIGDCHSFIVDNVTVCHAWETQDTEIQCGQSVWPVTAQTTREYGFPKSMCWARETPSKTVKIGVK
jgi:hypothetical protein